MSYEWSHLLHHNTHFHVLHEYDFVNGVTLVNPTGCGEGDTYWYELNVKVTDQGGLTAFDSKMFYSDCNGELESENEGEPEPEGEIDQISLYPNPTDGVLTIQSPESLGSVVELNIIDAMGREVRSESINILLNRKYFKINVSALPAGVYTLNLVIKGKRNQMKFLRID